MFKKCQVVMLHTNEKAKNELGLLLHKSKKLYLGNRHGCKGTKLYDILAISNSLNGKIIPCNEKDCLSQHLYILSDEEIKEGDWVVKINDLYKEGGIIQQYSFIDTQFEDIVFKKIIATTDKSLLIDGYDSSNEEAIVKLYLPQPSQSFIEKYVSEYNKGNIIKEVMVEFEFGSISESYFDKEIEKLPIKLKINPKDNTITIKKIKDNWTREEIILLFGKAQFEGIITPKIIAEDFNKWIEQNL